ncbi:MAG: 23S rRNA (adenine(2503)-C(2))-methyltransferase RlmN [Ignavibacterium sp.]|nr:23S rRNA (adenine(2503)-C(2))-methyltransferase RlmN [Ignavibacterium sp.]MCX7611648.1 23S rRNA (adenine(2503)-C(2))-methyltransferase RlmN [Ignavibacterium sp.]MDW8374473.1 23S rRNA (adenine(2503)-C(2))-methyltransferase RlmN [Ignavibacteriales bacterium]
MITQITEQEKISKTVLKGLTLKELKEFFEAAGEKRYRGEQVFEWMYGHLIDNFDQMENIPKYLRKKLNSFCELITLKLHSVEESKITGTRKYIFETKDNFKIESVIIPEAKRTTLCISTQVGCPLDCKFCATGLMGYKRNLTTGEIFDQFLLASKDYKLSQITNIVYMGMGEPLLNFNNTLKSLKIFSEEKTRGISLKKITVSTAGIPHKIIELADSQIGVKIAFSLHSLFDETRSKIMPINKKYNLSSNLEAIRYYVNKTKTRVTFEYVMFNDLNDREDDFHALVKLCKSLPCKVNVIPFNSIAHMFPTGISKELKPSPKQRIEEFVQKLRDKGITVTVRFTQGDDIAAACGQLAYKFENN